MKVAFALVALAVACTRLEAETVIPEMAEICGIRVGFDTMETLERVRGRGLPQVGGHAHGGRIWRAPRAGCDISADAFFYCDYGLRSDGRVLDFVSVTPLSHDPEIPATSLSRKQGRFLGVVCLGMTKDAVSRALKSRLPPPKKQGASLRWEASGFARVNHRNNVVTTAWQTALFFKNNKLQEIRIQCFPDYAFTLFSSDAAEPTSGDEAPCRK